LLSQIQLVPLHHVDQYAPRKSVRCYFADNSLTDSRGSTTCPNSADTANVPNTLFDTQSPCTVGGLGL
jgi:hypothetical protein